MTWTKWSLQQTTFAFATSLVLIGFIDSLGQVQATHSLTARFGDLPTVRLRQHTVSPLQHRSLLKGMQGQAINRLQASLKFILPPPPYRGLVGRRKGAASRGECPPVRKPLTALVPGTDEPSGKRRELAVTTARSVLGLTTAEYPTFWFYVPYALTPERSVEFVLLDDHHNYIYKTTFTAAGTSPGVIGFRLPSVATALEFGKVYHWYFLINCDLDDPVFVEGWVQRITLSPTLKSQLGKATPRGRIALYAANGIWHEAVTSLAELRQANPENALLATDWAGLMQSIGLGNITSEPIVSVVRYQEIKLDTPSRTR